MMCAHGRVGQTHINLCASPFLKEFCMARLHLYLNHALPFSQKEAAPRLCRPFLFSNPPPPKNQNGEERQGERAGRAVLRAWRGSRRSGRTFRVKATTHAPRARLGVLLEVGSDFLIQLPQRRAVTHRKSKTLDGTERRCRICAPP